MNTTLGYTRELDGLRGVAIIMVMLSHIGIPTIGGGFFGVDIFFVLSGFLITRLLLQEFDTRNMTIALGNFYMRRVLRLGPALLLLLAAYCVIGWLAGKPQEYSWRALIALFYLTNWVQAFQVYPMDKLSHTWSLSVEEQFYIVWPLLLIVLARRIQCRERLAALISAAIVLDVAFRVAMVHQGLPWWRIHYGLDARADPLLVGCLLGVTFSSPRLRSYYERHTRMISWGAVLGCAFLTTQLVMLEPLETRINQYHLWGMPLTALATAFLLLHIFVHEGGPLRALLGSRPLVEAGRISYGLYLWHYLVFNAIGVMLQSQPVSPVVVLFLIIPAAFALTWLVAWASFRYVEAPTLRLKRIFVAKDTVSSGLRDEAGAGAVGGHPGQSGGVSQQRNA